MLTVNEVKNNINNYIIEDGFVIDKNTGLTVDDENKILEILSSILAYEDAKWLYLTGIKEKEMENACLKWALTKYGLNGEENNVIQNKLIREIIEGDGIIEIEYEGKDVFTSNKLSFLWEPKNEYGLAAIKYIARSKGIDISNLDVSLDLSEFIKRGISKITVTYTKEEYTKEKEHSENTRLKTSYPSKTKKHKKRK